MQSSILKINLSTSGNVVHTQVQIYIGILNDYYISATSLYGRRAHVNFCKIDFSYTRSGSNLETFAAHGFIRIANFFFSHFRTEICFFPSAVTSGSKNTAFLLPPSSAAAEIRDENLFPTIFLATFCILPTFQKQFQTFTRPAFLRVSKSNIRTNIHARIYNNNIISSRSPQNFLITFKIKKFISPHILSLIIYI